MIPITGQNKTRYSKKFVYPNHKLFLYSSWNFLLEKTLLELLAVLFKITTLDPKISGRTNPGGHYAMKQALAPPVSLSLSLTKIYPPHCGAKR